MKWFFSLFLPLVAVLDAVAAGFERHAISVVCAVERWLDDAFPVAPPLLPRETQLERPHVIGLEQTRAFQARREACTRSFKPDWLEHGVGLAA